MGGGAQGGTVCPLRTLPAWCTGVNGRMKPHAHLDAYLAEKGIEFLVGDNDVAVKWYNELKASSNVGACFHLSC